MFAESTKEMETRPMSNIGKPVRVTRVITPPPAPVFVPAAPIPVPVREPVLVPSR